MVEIQEVYNKVENLLYLEDHDLLDLLLAQAISHKQKHTKLWLTIIGNSGSGKSQFANLMDGFVILDVTSSAFVSGKSDKQKINHKDLVLELKGKRCIIPDFGEILNGNRDSMKLIASKLTNLYDGIAKRNTANSSAEYKDLDITFTFFATPIYDSFYSFRNAIGTRELIFRCKNVDEIKLLERTSKNVDIDLKPLEEDAKKIIKEFLAERDYKEFKISEEIERKLLDYARLGSNLRASNESDSNGDSNTLVNKESPTRLHKCLKILYKSLMSLSDNYKTEDALKIIKQVVYSSGDPIRLLILEKCIRNDVFKFTRRDLGNELRISPKKAYMELCILFQLGLVKREDILTNEFRDEYVFRFQANNENDLIKFMAKDLDVQLNPIKI